MTALFYVILMKFSILMVNPIYSSQVKFLVNEKLVEFNYFSNGKKNNFPFLLYVKLTFLGISTFFQGNSIESNYSIDRINRTQSNSIRLTESIRTQSNLHFSFPWLNLIGFDYLKLFDWFNRIRLLFDRVRLLFDWVRLLFDWVRLLFDWVR